MNAATDHDLLRAAERAFGPFAEALGFGPWRGFVEAMQQLAAAQADECLALAEYASVASTAWTDGLARLASQLNDAAAGQAVDSPTALLRLWVRSLDAATHDAMLSEPGLDATAAAVRAAAHRRIGQQRLVELTSDALGVPTRSEVDAAFREIQALKRELRQLKRAARGTDR